MPTETSTFRAIEFAFTGYPVTDLARSRAFYEDLLGLKTGCVWLEGDKGWVEYDLAGHTLAITNGSDQWKPGAGGPSLAIEVEHFESAIATLRQHGVRFILEPMTSPACRLAVVLDPDGNALAIHKRNEPQPHG